MKEKIFIDAIDKLSFIKGIIHMNTINLEQNENKNELNNNKDFNVINGPEIITSVDGFVSSYLTMTDLLKSLIDIKLIDDSILKQLNNILKNDQK